MLRTQSQSYKCGGGEKPLLHTRIKQPQSKLNCRFTLSLRSAEVQTVSQGPLDLPWSRSPISTVTALHRRSHGSRRPINKRRKLVEKNKGREEDAKPGVSCRC